MIIKFSTPFRFVAATARAAFAKIFRYQVLAPVEVWDKRLDQCMNCEELVEDQCAICTCLVDAKTSLALEQCPKKKWQRVWIRCTI